MKAAVVNTSGNLLYFGNIKNPKFTNILVGNIRVDIPPGNNDFWNGSIWSKSAKPIPTTPSELRDGTGNISRAEMNSLKRFIREQYDYI